MWSTRRWNAWPPKDSCMPTSTKASGNAWIRSATSVTLESLWQSGNLRGKPGETEDRRSEVRGQRSEVRNGGRNSHENRLSKRVDGLQKGLRTGDEGFRDQQDFPAEERYALTEPDRARCSRSVCLNLREAWAKRRYEAHFVSKLTTVMAKQRDDSSLDFTKDCGYISIAKHAELTALV